MRSRPWPIALLALVGALAPAAARAQSTVAQVVVVGAFVDPALTGSAIRDLDFGATTIGTPVTVAPNATAACTGCASGLWTLNNLTSAAAANRRYVDVTFTLPSALVEPTSGATLAISWVNAARACLVKAGVEYSCYATWTPASGVQRGLQINGPGAPATPGGPGQRDMNVYLGGTISPTSGQRAGTYHATVSLTYGYGAT